MCIGDPQCHPASITKILWALGMINPIATYTSVYNLYFYDDTVPLTYRFVVVGFLADHHCDIVLSIVSLRGSNVGEREGGVEAEPFSALTVVF
jgi:hypothetical protein